MKTLILENKKLEPTRLLNYGFLKKNNKYYYDTLIHNNKFRVSIKIDQDKMITKLIETANEEEYILVDVDKATGVFVHSLKEEYNKIIKEIIKTCTSPNVFKENQTKEIMKYINRKYQDNFEYPWPKTPGNAIVRNKENKKWYALILTIEENKIKEPGNKIIEILDLRYSKEKINMIVDNKKIYPGYHMNKKSWITIKLDNSMPTEEILKLIDNSYHLSLYK